jgi:2',3'-cyclic-nucleotide 2'-phosphodiesterase (5'-nucleotidase family)
LQRGDHSVGILGLTWDKASVAPGQFEVLDAQDTLMEYIPVIAEQADVIIVLSTMGFEEDQALSSAIPGIDLIVGGRSMLPLPESWRNPTTGTLIVQAGFQGEWIGRRLLFLDSRGVVTTYRDELLYLTDDIPDDPEMRAFLDGLAQG